MKQLYRVFPALAPDYTGISSLLFEERAITVFVDPHGCNGQSLYYMEPRYDAFRQMPRSFSCGIREKDAVFGVDELVRRKVSGLLKYVDGAYIVLVGTPVPAALGLDFSSLARQIQRDTGLPTFGLATNGLSTYDRGQIMLLHALMDRIEQEPGCFPPLQCDVHLIGATTLDGWDATAVRDYTELLKDCGARSVACWGRPDLIHAMAGAPWSRLNIAVSSAGYTMARRLQQTYGTPFLAGYPVGAAMESRFRTQVRAILDGKPLPEFAPVRPVSSAPLHSVLLLGDRWNNEALGRCLSEDYHVPEIQMGDCFPGEGPYADAVPDCFPIREEEELFQHCLEHGPYDCIVGDPLFRPLVETFTRNFVPNPHVAVSGRLYWNEMDRLFGPWGDRFLSRILAGADLRGQ